MKSTLCAIILTKNEEHNITDCIKSLSFADEILVVDDSSEDSTAKKARKLGARVLVHKLETFAKQRNYALDNAQADWFLFIDADERVSSELAREIVSVVQNN